MIKKLEKLAEPVKPETQALIDRYQREFEAHRKNLRLMEEAQQEHFRQRGELMGKEQQAKDAADEALGKYRCTNILFHEGRAQRSQLDEATKTAAIAQDHLKAVQKELEALDDKWHQQERTNSHNTVQAAQLAELRYNEALHKANMEKYANFAREIISALYVTRQKVTQPGQPPVTIDEFLKELLFA